jgi:ribokinase
MGPSVDQPDQPAELDVLVVGDANPDLVLRGDVRPRFGQAEQLVDTAALVLGGSGGITACGLARLGLRTSLVARVGADVFGDFVRAELTRRGVRTDALRSAGDTPTGLSVVLSERTDRAILTFPGTIPTVRAADVPDAALAAARHVHVSSFFLQPALAGEVAALFARARAGGATTSLDTNWDPAGRWAGVGDVLAYTDFFFPNAAELLAVTGRDPYDESGTDDAAAEIAARGATVVLKLGARGARAWWPGGGWCAAPGIPVTVLDTTGAGDSFNAGFIAAHLSGLDRPACVAYAAAAGSLSTRAAGGTAAQATFDEVRAAVLTPSGR